MTYFLGSRFALMEIKAILYYLLLNFSLQLDKKIRNRDEIEKNLIKLVAENNIHFELKPRKKV